MLITFTFNDSGVIQRKMWFYFLKKCVLIPLEETAEEKVKEEHCHNILNIEEVFRQKLFSWQFIKYNKDQKNNKGTAC